MSDLNANFGEEPIKKPSPKKKGLAEEEYELGTSKNIFTSSQVNSKSTARAKKPLFSNTSSKEFKTGLGFIDKPISLVKSIRNTVQKSSRLLDGIISQDYKDYKRNIEGKTSLSQLSTKELKYLNRDHKLANHDNSHIKAELKSRQLDYKAFNRSARVNTAFTIKADGQSVHIGVDKKSGKLLISENNYKNNPNIQSWRKLGKDDISKVMLKKGKIHKLNVIDNTQKLRGSNITPEKKQDILNRVESSLSKLYSKDLIKDVSNLNQKTKAKDLSKGLVADKNGNLQTVRKVDKHNVILNPMNKKKAAKVVNVAATVATTLYPSSKVVGLVSKGLLLAVNKKNGKALFGKVKADKSISWTSKKEHYKSISPKAKEALKNKLAKGNYVVSPITKIGVHKDTGKPLYAAQKANGEYVISLNKKNFVKPHKIATKDYLMKHGVSKKSADTLMSRGDKSLTPAKKQEQAQTTKTLNNAVNKVTSPIKTISR